MEMIEMTVMEELKVFNHFYQHYHSTPKEAKLDLPPYCDNHYKFVVDGEIIGITAIKWLSPDLIQSGPTIIHPNYRGMGYGKKALQLIEHEVTQLGARKICCEVFTFNLPMIVSKLKQGHIIEGLMRDHDTKGLDQYFMSKML